MAKNNTTFTKGQAKGKPKGAVNKTTKSARELFVSIMEGEVSNIKDALSKVRTKNPAEYLNVLSKFYPYFIPKKLDVTTDGKSIPAPIIELTKVDDRNSD
jgi:hypothetical protein